MIKAIIFDLFGVLATEGVTSFRDAYFPTDKEKLKQVDQWVEQLNMGTLPYNEFIKKLATLEGISEEQVRNHLDSNQPNKPLLNYIKQELKAKYKIGVISNSGGDWIYEILDKEDVELFDDIVLSHREGVVKPEPSIYAKSLENLNVRAQESVFIDDVQRYCEAAQSLGMQTVRYENFGQMKLDLEKILAAGSNN